MRCDIDIDAHVYSDDRKMTRKRLRFLDIILKVWNLDSKSDSICAIGCTSQSLPNRRLSGLDIVSGCGPGVSAKSGYGLTVLNILQSMDVWPGRLWTQHLSRLDLSLQR